MFIPAFFARKQTDLVSSILSFRIMSIKLTQMVTSVLELTAFKGFKQEWCYGVQVWIFEHLAHPMLSFCIGYFWNKKKYNTNQDIIQPRKGIRPATTNLHNIFISGRFQLYTFFCWDSTHNTSRLKGKKLKKLDRTSVRISFLQLLWSLGLQY